MKNQDHIETTDLADLTLVPVSEGWQHNNGLANESGASVPYDGGFSLLGSQSPQRPASDRDEFKSFKFS